MFRTPVLALCAVACTSTPVEPAADTPDPTVQAPEAPHVVRSLALTDHLTSPTPAGVTVDRDSGEWIVLESQQGLFAERDGTLVPIADDGALQRDGIDMRPFTDVVSLGGGRYSVTVANDGLLHDLTTGETTQHFCYVPGGMPIDLIDNDAGNGQVTWGVAFDADAGLLFAQPRSFEDSVAIGAHIGSYDVTDGGQPQQWFDLDDIEFSARGMVWHDGQLLLGSGSMLYTYTMGDAAPVPYTDLASFGVEDLQGLAIGPDDTLVVIDDDAPVTVRQIAGWQP